MQNYQITIGYKAVVCIQVKAENEKDAKEIALDIFKSEKIKMYKRKVELQDDNFKADGCLNMDETWNMVQN